MNWKVVSCSAALLIGRATPAQAATVFLQQFDDVERDLSVDSFEFATEPSLGRAWVDLLVEKPSCVGGDGCDRYGKVNARVPGLRRTGDRIVFSSGSRETLCATVVHRRFLFVRYDDIETTGRCDVTTAHGSRTIDTGFKVTTIPVLEVYFRVAE